MKVFNLTSTSMIHSPGMIKYITLDLKDNLSLQRNMINTGWPGLTNTAIVNLLNGLYTVDGDTVHVAG